MDFSIQKISENNYDDLDPTINAQGQVVWRGNGIYYWDTRLGGVPQKISNKINPDCHPAINDQGQVVWYGSDGNDNEIYYWDARIGGAPQKVSNNSYIDEHPAINDQGQVVWDMYDGNDSEIYYWDPRIGGAPQKISNNSYCNEFPAINDQGQVVWDMYDGNDSEIYYWDPRIGGAPQLISINSSWNYSPLINAQGQVVWYGSDGYGDEIYYWDARVGGVPQKISSSYSSENPFINAQGQVVWYSKDGFHGGWDVGYWDARVGGEPQKISHHEDDDYWSQPLVIFGTSPINDQGQVVWYGYDGQKAEIYYWDARVGGVPQKISNNDYRECSPAINDQGQVVWYGSDGGSDWEIFSATPVVTVQPEQIVFSSNQTGNEDIYLMNRDGSGWTNLTNNAASDGYPSYNPYDNTIVFTSDRSGNWDIYSMNADGTGVVDLTNNPADDGYPCFSPDGSKIAFASTRDGNRNIYVMNKDGSGVTKLTEDPVEAVHPSWSPDGTKILFASDRDGDRDIYCLDLATNQVTNLTNNTAVYDDYPAWSPTADEIVYATDYTSHDSSQLDLWLMSATGANQHALYASSSDERQPSWSPDGQSVVFSEAVGSSSEIFTINRNGSGLTQLTANTSTENHPHFTGPPVEGYVSTAQQQVGVINQPIQDNYILNGCKLLTPYDFGEAFNSNEPSLIYIHGWDTDGVDEIWDWDKNQIYTNANNEYVSDYVKMAEASKDKANVFIWDWTTWATSAQSPPVDNAFISASFLTRLLMDYFGTHPGYDQPMQFVAHSLGGPVALTTAKGLDDISYRGMTFNVDQVTLLDPYYCGPLLTDVHYDFYVDQYASLVSRTYFPLDLGNYTVLNSFIYGADANVLIDDVELTKAQDFSSVHNQAVQYYLASIKDSDIPAGFQWSEFHPDDRPNATSSLYYFGYVGDNDKTNVQEVTLDEYFAEAQAKEVREITRLAIQGAELYDNIVHHPVEYLGWLAAKAGIKYIFGENSAIELSTGSPVYVYQSLTLPENAVDLALTYQVVSAADDDSYVALLINDDLLYYEPANNTVGAKTTFVFPDISKYAGQTVNLTFLVDDPDSIGGATVQLQDVEIGEGYSYNPYTFTYTYANGDTVTGTVYAASDQGYYPGLSWAGSEQGQAGTYEITGVGPGSSDFAGKIGQVFIASYRDTATGLVYTPLEYTQGLPSGEDYLGSEQFRGGIAQVTDNSGYFDVAPQVLDDGRILWQGWDGHDYEIYCLVPGQGITQLTNNDSPDAMPQMNASGQAVWMNWDGQDWEVWYNLGSGPVQLTNNAGAFDVLPQITADAQVYWQGWDGHDYEIYHYNPTTKATTQLTDNALPDAAPEVNASGQLTWMGQDGSNWQVYYNTGNGPVQLTTSGANLSPQITDAGQLFWQGWDSSDYEIYRYTIGSGPTENLTNNTVNDMTPAVNNGVLVWSQWDGSYWQIYREFLNTGLITQITDDSYDNRNPQVNASGQVVWQKWDGSDFEVYAYK